MAYREIPKYIKEEDHDKEINAVRKEHREANEKTQARQAAFIRAAEHRGFERGVDAAWKDAMALLRRLKMGDAKAAIEKIHGTKGK
jgi:hypothetical protein